MLSKKGEEEEKFLLFKIATVVTLRTVLSCLSDYPKGHWGFYFPLQNNKNKKV